MNNQKEVGTRQLCGRLVEALDSILDAINRSQDLTEEDKQKIAPIVVEYRDLGIKNFIYGIEDEPVGLEIYHNKKKLNDESYEMQQAFDEMNLVDFSRFDASGRAKH